jgi:glycosyltransferase involved in cell wall biosynthesis
MTSSSLNICQVLASTGDGGLEKHVRELSLELVKAGQRVHVMAPAEFIHTLPEGVQGHILPLHRGRLNPFSLVRLASAIRRNGCQIAHAHATKAAFMLGMVRPWLNCPTVASVHNIKRNTTAYLRHRHIIAVSQTLARSFPADKVSVVYHGIQSATAPEQDLRKEFGLPQGQPILIAVGRLVPAKGFDLLLQAVSGLPVTLLLAGNGPERPALSALAQQCQGPTVVRLLGHRDDVTRLIANSDAVIISSRREGFSYVFGEAVMLHKPVLSTDVPIPNEVLPPELITATESASALRERLTALLQDMDGWRRRMAPAFEFANSRLTLPAMSENTLKVYLKTLNT